MTDLNRHETWTVDEEDISEKNRCKRKQIHVLREESCQIQCAGVDTNNGTSIVELLSDCPNIPSDKGDKPLLIDIADDFENGRYNGNLVKTEGIKTPSIKHWTSNHQEHPPVEGIFQITQDGVHSSRKTRKRRMLKFHTFQPTVVTSVDSSGINSGTGPGSHMLETKDKYLPPLSEQETSAGIRMVRVHQESDDIDLSLAMGIPKEERTHERVESRRPLIKARLQNGGHLSFNSLEEYDIHCRAEYFVKNLIPDREYCVVQGKAPVNGLNDCSIVNVLSEVSRVQYDRGDGSRQMAPRRGGERKRRRHSCGDVDCYVVHPTVSHANLAKNDKGYLLPEGLCLLRPPNKLVELVAQVINDSPDGMLQVQQVYIALQNIYPYFQYMDKTSTTSWRSSIRHALYQKWFRKIPFSTDLINTKGCYWAINRRHQPREWTLPPTKDEGQEVSTSKVKEDAEDLGLSTMLSAVDDYDIHHISSQYPYIDYGASMRKIDNQERQASAAVPDVLDVPPVEPDPSGYKENLLPRPRDPDPMLSPKDYEQAINSQDVTANSSESSNDSTYTASMKSEEEQAVTMYDENRTPIIVYGAQSFTPEDADAENTGGSLDSFDWISRLDTSPSPLNQQCRLTDYHAPLLTPYCVSYSMVPPIDLADTALDDIPICIKPYDEHW